MKITITKKQAELIAWALYAGLDQHRKFLLHDNWDAGLTKKDRHEYLAVSRRLIKAIKLFDKKREEL